MFLDALTFTEFTALSLGLGFCIRLMADAVQSTGSLLYAIVRSI